jgi:hypothetical protein
MLTKLHLALQRDGADIALAVNEYLSHPSKMKNLAQYSVHEAQLLLDVLDNVSLSVHSRIVEQSPPATGLL